MRKIDIQVIRCDLLHIKNDSTGEITDMTKITYLTKMEPTELSRGYAILESYRRGNYMNQVSPFLDKKITTAEMSEKPLKNGVKYVITKLDNVDL